MVKSKSGRNVWFLFKAVRSLAQQKMMDDYWMASEPVHGEPLSGASELLAKELFEGCGLDTSNLVDIIYASDTQRIGTYEEAIDFMVIFNDGSEDIWQLFTETNGRGVAAHWLEVDGVVMAKTTTEDTFNSVYFG